LEGDAYNPEVFLGDVRVSAKINVDGLTDDFLGLMARDSDVTWNEGYWAAVVFLSSSRDAGRLQVGKLGADNLIYNISTGRVADLARSYFLELLVSDDTSTGYPTVTGRLFEYDGGPELLHAELIDTNLQGLPLWRSGIAGVWAAEIGHSVLNATFDDIRAVPEPGTLALLLTGAVGIALWIRRRKVAA
jgi:hypothetical protein